MKFCRADDLLEPLLSFKTFKALISKVKHMTSIDVVQSLRPLKLAYIVRPNDMASLKKAIETNAFLWGARYNPVLPLYKKTPQYLKRGVRGGNIRELLYGNLKFFEPDFIVITGDIRAEEIAHPPCEIIKLEDICDNIAEEEMPGYGIGLLEIVGEYYDREFKFIRRDKRSHYYPSYGAGYNCFLKSVFGCFPQELSMSGLNSITMSLQAKAERITLDNYLSFLELDGPLNVHRLSSYNLNIDYTKRVARERNAIFVLDSLSFIDVLDYINLKAAGYTVLPILRSSLNSDQAKKICLEFIDDEAWVHRDNPHATYDVTMLKSRSVTQKELEAFYRFVEPPSFEGQEISKCFMRFDFPDFWSRWHQEKGHVGCATVTACKKENAAITNERHIRLKVIAPSFLSNRIPRPFNSRFANDIAVTNYSSNQDTFGADIYPSNSDEVVRAAGLFGIDEWLIKDSGITKLCRAEDEQIIFDNQNATEIFLSWLKSEGWDANISDAGKVAYQMLKHLGGPWGITLLQGEKLIKFLVGKNDEDRAEERTPPSSGLERVNFFKKIKEAYNDHRVRWGEDNFIKSFFEHNIFRLGLELQCSVCARRSWYPIDVLRYTNECPHCLSTFEVPSHDPSSIKWSYKTIGPFSAAGKAAGAYSVLLTAKFFNQSTRIHNATTTILSFKAKKDDFELEVDCGLFYRESSYFNRSTELIFCECKTYKHFDREDVDTMRNVAREFPGSILVFSTLNDKLTQEEQRLIRPFVKTCNKYHERDRPKNPVMILTATELFASHHPPYCWKDKGRLYKPFADNSHIHGLLDTCQATQKIYLDIDLWRKGWVKEWEKKRNAKE